MIKKEIKIELKCGFTLVELMMVIAIIGILSSVILVSTSGARDKANTSSAISTMSSILPELVTCADDVGYGIDTVVPSSNTFVCCNGAAHAISSCDTLDTDNKSGHIVKWPDISKTGYKYIAPTGKLSDGTYQFTATKSGQPTITCSYADNGCSTP